MTTTKRRGGVGRIVQRLGGLAYELTPQVFAGLINAPAFLSRLGNEHGVSSLETLLKTEDQMAQEQQQAMAQQAMQAATPAIAEAAIGAATQDPNQGT